MSAQTHIGRLTWRKRLAWLAGLVAALAIVVSVLNLERDRTGLSISSRSVGTTPATLYRLPGGQGPLVIVAHGFAGSRQLMQAYSLTLAQAGYTVLAFDFEGHGRNPVPMSGDVTAIDGTTALLVGETRRVIAAGRERIPKASGVALLGHSMATDILIRAAIAEREDGTPVDAIVAISMFSGAVTAKQPKRLLAISGEWETRLREVALADLQMLQEGAREGETAAADGVTRRAVVAPGVEHVGVLFSATALREARAWLDATFERSSEGQIALPGLWILLLMAGIVGLFKPLTGLLPETARPPARVSAQRFWASVLIPAVAVPLVAVTLYIPFLPVLVADYLMIHLALYGIAQLVLLRAWKMDGAAFSGPAVLLLVIWGTAVFGLAMDRYAASFMATGERLAIIATLAVGTVPFMIADAFVTGAGRGPWWRRAAARIAVLLSLGGAAALDPERLMFIFLILPVLVLFYLVHGLMGRWIARRSGPLSAGLGLGLCLAWALGVSFPLFSPG
ncbi:alpha/beta fold hydrolase [Stappia sp. ES.058]|uniref:alpha/beta fold hydrolase n=1 Tax=Stappia sp. ES.058 TaxID=1881061 RepID=UPI00087C9495|nr:alpha/beta fold hydrolase [Stappia sp. ES.058]SDU14130.1 Serine aminopeptidase, S33 [Stappia sp. ES.058]